MVRFSCFNAHGHSQKTKRSSLEVMHKALEDCPQTEAPKDFTYPARLNLNDNGLLVAGSAAERSWKSEEIKGEYNVGSVDKLYQTGQMKKSRSLGNVLEQERRNSVTKDAEDDIYTGYSCDDAHDENGFVGSDGSRDPGTSTSNHCQEAFPSESPQLSSDIANNESILSVGGDTKNLEKEGHEYSDSHPSGQVNAIFDEITSPRLPVIVKSCSMPKFGSNRQTPFSFTGTRSRSYEDLHAMGMREKKNSIFEVRPEAIEVHENDDSTSKGEKNNLETIVEDGYGTYNYGGTAKDWVIPVMDEVDDLKELKVEYSEQWNGSPGRNFKTKRVEEWVINLQHCCSLEESNEAVNDTDNVKGVPDVDGLAAARLDSKVTPGMEAAKNYISSLPATATTAQLASHGLVVIPFLSAFVSLKVLNLSGNAIVRITAGALPRGLHMLNLSKNNISTIEGLRELTRLRVLDLSYNRIFRIGHGLASCSSLKELYLAGNKISEVEGLHRLLKLSVLDLRFNKISTAKCLGQLAANYSAMQAISLEGNPAQKNVGDDQLKRQLQGLLPNLVYYNRQPMKAGTLKDPADWSTRLGVSHQFDRGLRSEHRSRKGSHGIATHKASSSSTHARKSQAVTELKSSRGKHLRLPPSSTRATTQYHHQCYDYSSKLPSPRPDLSMRRSRSEGTLGAI